MSAHATRRAVAAVLVGVGVLLTEPAVPAQQTAEQLRVQADQGNVAAQSTLEARAAQGDATAQFALAGMYADADGPLTRDTVEATRWLRLAAEQGHEAAQLSLGVFYLVGEGVPQDPVEAERWFRMAAEQGNALAQNHLGHIYQGAPEPFRTDRDVPVDHAESIRWFERSAEQGNLPAAISLAVKYRDGTGVPKALEPAFRWFRWAADRGDVAAMTEVGGMYAAGRGVAQDDVSAYMWLDLATRYAGGEDREFLLIDREGVAQRLNARQIAEAERRANEWTPMLPR